MSKQSKFNGQTMVEFALLIPFVLVILLGFFDLGRGFFYNSSLSNAVRHGTRVGIVTPRNATPSFEGVVRQEVLDYAFGLTTTSSPLTNADINVHVTWDDDKFRQTLTVTATYCFVPITPGIHGVFGDGCSFIREGKVINIAGIQLTSESQMLFEPGFR